VKLRKALSSKWYVDPDIFQKEREVIFKRGWWPFTPLHNLANPGDYVADSVCSWPAFALRGKDGELRTFLNICRHRGASLLPPGSGNVDSISCPYHGWLYGDDGRLLKTPRFGAQLESEYRQLSLQRIGHKVWNGMIFVQIDQDEGLSFGEWIGEVDDLCKSFAGPANLDYYGKFQVTGDLNWKTYCDNTVEGYHLRFVHPRLAKTLSAGNVELRCVNNGRSVVFDVAYGRDGADLRGKQGTWVYHFPGMQLVLGDKLFKIERVEATAVGSVRSTNWAWYGGLSDAEREDAFVWARQIVEEDFAICSSVTKNMASGSYIPGPLSPAMEQHVMQFQDRIRELIG